MFVSLHVTTANSSLITYGLLRVHTPCTPRFLHNWGVESKKLFSTFSNTCSNTCVKKLWVPVCKNLFLLQWELLCLVHCCVWRVRCVGC